MLPKLFPPDSHPSITEIRDRITSEQIQLLDYVWKHFCLKERWPTRWECVTELKSHADLFQLGKELSGNLVLEVGGFDQRTIQLTPLGVLSTSSGSILEEILLSFFEFLMGSIMQLGVKPVISYRDFYRGISLDSEHLLSLYKMFSAFHFGPLSAWAPPPNGELIVSVDADILMDYASPEAYLRAYVFNGYKADHPFSIDDRSAAGLNTKYIEERHLQELLQFFALSQGYANRLHYISSSVSFVLMSLITAALLFFTISWIFPAVLPIPGSSTVGYGIAQMLGLLGIIWGISLFWIWKRGYSLIRGLLYRLLNLGIPSLSAKAFQEEVNDWAVSRGLLDEEQV